MSGRWARDLAPQLVGVAGLADDLEPGLGEQPREPLAVQRVVLADQDAHGSSARDTVRSSEPVGTLGRTPAARTGCPANASGRRGGRRPGRASAPASAVSTRCCLAELVRQHGASTSQTVRQRVRK